MLLAAALLALAAHAQFLVPPSETSAARISTVSASAASASGRVAAPVAYTQPPSAPAASTYTALVTVTVEPEPVASAASAAPTASQSNGASAAAIVLGVLCALEALVIAVLALRTRNLKARADRLTHTLRDIPTPQHHPISTPMALSSRPHPSLPSPLPSPMFASTPLMKPMQVMHVAPPQPVHVAPPQVFHTPTQLSRAPSGSTPITRKVSRKAPPKYEEE